MRASRFQTITSRFSPQKLRTSFRRSSTSSSTSSTSSRASSCGDGDSFISSSSGGSPVSTINSIIIRQKTMMLEDQHLEAEDARDLGILEPRPAATFRSLEERMACF